LKDCFCEPVRAAAGRKNIAGLSTASSNFMTCPSRQSISRRLGSPARRAFDISCVLLLFPQKRVGRIGRIFTLLKFRTIANSFAGPI